MSHEVVKFHGSKYGVWGNFIVNYPVPSSQKVLACLWDKVWFDTNQKTPHDKYEVQIKNTCTVTFDIEGYQYPESRFFSRFFFAKKATFPYFCSIILIIFHSKKYGRRTVRHAFNEAI